LSSVKKLQVGGIVSFMRISSISACNYHDTVSTITDRQLLASSGIDTSADIVSFMISPQTQRNIASNDTSMHDGHGAWYSTIDDIVQYERRGMFVMFELLHRHKSDSARCILAVPKVGSSWGCGRECWTTMLVDDGHRCYGVVWCVVPVCTRSAAEHGGEGGWGPV